MRQMVALLCSLFKLKYNKVFKKNFVDKNPYKLID